MLERTLYLYPDLCGWDEILERGTVAVQPGAKCLL